MAEAVTPLRRSTARVYTLTPDFIREHHDATSSWEKVCTRGLGMSAFEGETGFELIAAALDVPYPSKVAR